MGLRAEINATFSLIARFVPLSLPSLRPAIFRPTPRSSGKGNGRHRTRISQAQTFCSPDGEKVSRDARLFGSTAR